MCHVTQQGPLTSPWLGHFTQLTLFCPLHPLQLAHGGGGVVRLMGWVWEVRDQSRTDGVAGHFGVPRPCPVLGVPRP